MDCGDAAARRTNLCAGIGQAQELIAPTAVEKTRKARIAPRLSCFRPPGGPRYSAGATWELDIKDKDLRAVAEKLNGKTIETTGTVESKKVATSPRIRTLVTVKTLESAEKK